MQGKCTDLRPDCGRGGASYWWSARSEEQADRSGSWPASSALASARCSGTSSPSRGNLSEEVLETLTWNQEQEKHQASSISPLYMRFPYFLFGLFYKLKESILHLALRFLQIVSMRKPLNVLCRALQPFRTNSKKKLWKILQLLIIQTTINKILLCILSKNIHAEPLNDQNFSNFFRTQNCSV